VPRNEGNPNAGFRLHPELARLQRVSARSAAVAARSATALARSLLSIPVTLQEEREMTPATDAEVEAIIQNHVGYAMAAAAIPVPLADIAAVTLVQLDMVKSLSASYSVSYDESRANAILVSLAGASLARLGASLFKAIPIAGPLVGAAAQIALSGASTYATGQLFRGLFEDSDELDGFDADLLRRRYEEYVEKGRRLARTLGRAPAGESQAAEAVAANLERLARLRRTGVITDEEFDRLSAPVTTD
jgi:uncharacterized protein (DUF697 family)